MDVLHETANFVQGEFFESEGLCSFSLQYLISIRKTVICVCVFIELPGIVLMATAPNNKFADNQRYPSVINLFATPDTYFIDCLSFMAEKYNWRILHIICEADGHSFVANICALIRGTLQVERVKNIALTRSSVDGSTNTSFDQVLEIAKAIRGSCDFLGQIIRVGI